MWPFRRPPVNWSIERVEKYIAAALQCIRPCPQYQTLSGPGTKQMDKPAQNIQDSFLNNARKEKGLVTIYLLSGVKLSGRIKSFDKYSLVLETSNQEQLIFKHAISTVVTTRAIQQHTAVNSHQSSAPP